MPESVSDPAQEAARACLAERDVAAGAVRQSLKVHPGRVLLPYWVLPK